MGDRVTVRWPRCQAGDTAKNRRLAPCRSRCITGIGTRHPTPCPQLLVVVKIERENASHTFKNLSETIIGSRDVMQSVCIPDLEFTLRPRRNGVRRVLGLLLAVAAWNFGTSCAWATCGDYVAVHNPAQRHAEGMWAPTPRQFNASSTERFPPTTPCHGPECRQQQRHLPVTPPPVTVTPPGELGILIDARLAKRFLVAAWHSSEDDQSSPKNGGLAIERPPKSLA